MVKMIRCFLIASDCRPFDSLSHSFSYVKMILQTLAATESERERKSQALHAINILYANNALALNISK